MVVSTKDLINFLKRGNHRTTFCVIMIAWNFKAEGAAGSSLAVSLLKKDRIFLKTP